ncbi:hypothetical protein [Streptomyces sp. NPDC048584]|uniref:hypothetical protein n=1 Tax=Streptomyces sp. NPDC048584 TaxID=3365573 RepID=UPI0037148086
MREGPVSGCARTAGDAVAGTVALPLGALVTAVFQGLGGVCRPDSAPGRPEPPRAAHPA